MSDLLNTIWANFPAFVGVAVLLGLLIATILKVRQLYIKLQQLQDKLSKVQQQTSHDSPLTKSK